MKETMHTEGKKFMFSFKVTKLVVSNRSCAFRYKQSSFHILQHLMRILFFVFLVKKEPRLVFNLKWTKT